MASKEFQEEVRFNIEKLSKDLVLKNLTKAWFDQSLENKYSYNFSSFSIPIIQYPQDMIAMQEIIWKVKPDIIIEAGIAHGGSLMMSAGMLAMIEYCEALEEGVFLNPSNPKRKVVGIDIDIRKHNREKIESHFLANRIVMLEGSSISDDIISKVHEYAKPHKSVLVILDSNHSHDHVLAELKAYAPLTSKGSYCVVYDTVIDDLPASQYPDRNWGPGDNPKTALYEYLNLLDEKLIQGVDGLPLSFDIDEDLEAKLQITVAPSGYLKRN